MTTLVLDTSVAVAWYLPEVFQPAARWWRRRMLDEEVRLIAPSLHYWEFANVLRTYVRRGELNRESALEIHALHLEAPIEILEPRRQDVLEVALRYDATAYDAVYISLALLLESRLLTAERTTRPWVVKLGDRVETVSAKR